MGNRLAAYPQFARLTARLSLTASGLHPARIAATSAGLATIFITLVRLYARTWKAQERLCRRYRKLIHAGKLKTVVTAAIARELSGFVWAIAKQTQVTSA